MAMRLLRRPWFLAVLFIILASALSLAWFLRPQEESLTKYQAMYDRGKYEACIDGLTEVLVRNPDWHEARDLQISAMLAEGLPVEALENLLLLLKSDYTSASESWVLNKLAASEPPVLGKGRALLEANLEAQPEFDKARVFLIRLDLAANNPGSALLHLLTLAQRGKTTQPLNEEVAAGCKEIDDFWAVLNQVSSTDTAHAWADEMKLRVALKLQNKDLFITQIKKLLESDTRLSDNLIQEAWHFALRTDFTAAMTLAVQQDRQDWMRTALSEAAQLDSAEANRQLPALLDLLVDYEESDLFPDALIFNRITRDFEYDYGTDKWKLIQAAEMYSPKYFQHIEPSLIFAQALAWREERPEKALALADWLEAKCSDTDEVSLLRQILTFSETPPLEIWTGAPCPELAADLALSPDGSWLICAYSSETAFVNLNSGKVHKFPSPASDWVWSPDSLRAIGLTQDTLEPALLSVSVTGGETQSPCVLPLPSCSEATLLGWQDNSTALLSLSFDKEVKAVSIDCESGQITWESELRTGWPTLNSDRELVWVWREGNSLFIGSGDNVTRFELESEIAVIPMEWFPGNGKLVFHSALTPTTGFTLDMEDGRRNYLELPRLYEQDCWIDDTWIWTGYPFWDHCSEYTAIFKKNMITGEMLYSGITLLAETGMAYSANANYMAVSTEQAVRVYEMP